MVRRRFATSDGANFTIGDMLLEHAHPRLVNVEFGARKVIVTIPRDRQYLLGHLRRLQQRQSDPEVDVFAVMESFIKAANGAQRFGANHDRRCGYGRLSTKEAPGRDLAER